MRPLRAWSRGRRVGSTNRERGGSSGRSVVEGHSLAARRWLPASSHPPTPWAHRPDHHRGEPSRDVRGPDSHSIQRELAPSSPRSRARLLERRPLPEAAHEDGRERPPESTYSLPNPLLPSAGLPYRLVAPFASQSSEASSWQAPKAAADGQRRPSSCCKIYNRRHRRIVFLFSTAAASSSLNAATRRPHDEPRARRLTTGPPHIDRPGQ